MRFHEKINCFQSVLHHFYQLQVKIPPFEGSWNIWHSKVPIVKLLLQFSTILHIYFITQYIFLSSVVMFFTWTRQLTTWTFFSLKLPSPRDHQWTITESLLTRNGCHGIALAINVPPETVMAMIELKRSLSTEVLSLLA